MAKKLELKEIRKILSEGTLEELIGVIEDEKIEAKSSPYQINSDHQKLELSKDISSFANADGGVILIGAGTERGLTHFGDEIKTTSPFLQSSLNPEQYHAIIKSWVYPTPQDIEVKWFSSSKDAQKGICAIFIPTQPTEPKPFLVTKTVDEKGKIAERIFGYFERKRANADPLAVHDLHSLIRDGFRFQSITSQLESIQQSILSMFSARSAEAHEISVRAKRELLDERVEQALKESGFQEKPAFFIGVIPLEPLEIPSLFKSRDEPVVRLLELPPVLRNSGFDLRTGRDAQIIRGQLRRAASIGFMSLELYRDGTLIFVCLGNQQYLSWGNYEAPPLRINQLALIEVTYLFAELSAQVFEYAEPKREQFCYTIGLRNMTLDGNPCILSPGALMNW